MKLSHFSATEARALASKNNSDIKAQDIFEQILFEIHQAAKEGNFSLTTAKAGNFYGNANDLQRHVIKLLYLAGYKVRSFYAGKGYFENSGLVINW